MNGGPGCSSLEGFLNELGPLHIASDGKTLFNNTFSWNRKASIIFLESPAGVGYSYSLKKKYTTNDDIVSLDNYVALQHFFEKFPHFKKNELYIAGESYAGVYVPTLSLRVLNGPAKINFKGFAIGNGYLDVNLLYNSLVFFVYYHGLIGTDLWKDLEQHCCNGTASQTNCKFVFSTNFKCILPVLKVLKLVDHSDLNVYNLYADCARAKDMNSQYLIDKKNMLGFIPMSTKDEKLRKEVSCVDSSNLSRYLNQPEIRKALHVSPFIQEWEVCSETVGAGYDRLYSTMKPQILLLLQSKKVRGLIYNGDIDMACNFLGDEWFCDDLGLEVIDSYSQWKFNGQIAGYAKYFDRLTFVTIKGSGHMVPQDKPGPAYKMISSFLNNEWL